MDEADLLGEKSNWRICFRHKRPFASWLIVITGAIPSGTDGYFIHACGVLVRRRWSGSGPHRLGRRAKDTFGNTTSLIALLRSVSVSWKQHAQTENARAIASAAEELYRRLMVFVDHMDKIKSGLETASGAYNKAVGSYERSIRPSGERLLKLSEHTVAEMKELTPSAQMLRDAPSPGKDT